MRYNHAITSDDPQAIEKLQEKLHACEQYQKQMKDINSYYRKHGTCRGCPGVTDEQAAKLDDKVKNGYSWEKSPVSSYELTNNNAEIRRLKQRIAQLTQDRETGFCGWTFAGGEAVINNDNNRLQLVFDEKPSEAQRGALKSAGFHWSPSEGAWQRQLNRNAIYAASRCDFLLPESGQSPISLQPKAPARDVPER